MENNVFFNQLFDVLKHSGIEDSNCYYDIIKQNYDVLSHIISGYNDNSTMVYQPANKDEWGCYGRIVIFIESGTEYGEYVLELCCYGVSTINLYLDGIHIERLVRKKSIDIEVEIQQIDNEIAELMNRKEDLLDFLRTNG